MKNLLSKKQPLLMGVIIFVLLACSYEFILPGIILRIATVNLRHVQAQQATTFMLSIEALGLASPQTLAECGGTAQAHWRTASSCRIAQFYRMTEPLPPASRDHTIKAAQNLDSLLLRSGWMIDRPQDPITTIAGSIPSKPLAAFTASQVVPYHKNVGDISCNLVIQFAGPTDGASPGVVSVNEFSCHQAILIIMPHIFTYAADPGYGG